jgi:hypothetical protein
VRYADDLVLLAKEETIIQSMSDKLIEVGRGYGMEINVEKTKTMNISRQPTPLQIKLDNTPLENVEEFNYLGNMITNDARCTRDIKDCHGKSSIQQEEDSLYQQIRLRAKEKISEVLHLEHSFVWCGNLDSSESRSEVPGKF